MAKFKQRRSSELYMSFKEARQQIEKEARESSVTIEQQWQQQGTGIFICLALVSESSCGLVKAIGDADKRHTYDFCHIGQIQWTQS